MRVLREGDSRLAKILGKKKVCAEERYRLSQFTVFLKSGRALLKNTLTGSIVLLDSENLEELALLKDAVWTGRQVLEADLESLVELYIIVPVSLDECQLYRTVRLLLEKLDIKPKGVNKYTILPTLGCNARCSYCYEEGIHKYVMSERTADEIVRYISHTKQKDEICIYWFGGEPLTASNIIVRICEGLAQNGIQFTSVLISNGVLMNSQLLQTAITDWHLKKVQISVDGEKADYEKRKNYCLPQAHNYDSMVASVKAMLDADIEVTLRCNYDHENLKGIRVFLDDIQEMIPNRDHLAIYFSMLFQEYQSPNCIQLYREVQEIKKYAMQLGFRQNKKQEVGLKTHYCMADSKGRHLVIDPQGEVHRCENLHASTTIGNVYDLHMSMPDNIDSEIIDVKCQKCPYLPECTPYYRKACPDYNPYCKEFKDIDLEYELNRIDIK